MKQLMILLMFLWVGMAVQAQADNATWDRVQQCVTLNYPIIRQGRWDFDGTIVSRNANGVHAIRSDMETGYYIALTSNNSFTLSGAFSPDRQWFAYFLGNISEANWVSSHYEITHLRIVSTDPRAEKYDYSWREIMKYVSSQYWGDDVVQWVDNESFIMLGVPNPPEQFGFESYNAFFDTKWSLVNFQSGEFVPATDTIFDSLPTQPLPDPRLRTGVFNPFAKLNGFIPSPDGNYRLASYGQNIYMIDLDNRQIIDFCLDLPNNLAPSYAWSPDGATIAFLYDGYLVLLDIETWQTQILDYQTSTLIHWLADEELE